MFEPIDFQGLSEADVREEIITPLLHTLGYHPGSENNLIREQLLRYPHAVLGRKKLGRDPLLRGKADYILVAGGRVRWVIEAKPPDAEIGADEKEQAWTYANHPEVRAVYFALCNGRQIEVCQTNTGPDAAPILHLDYDSLQTPDAYQRIENLLSPSAVLRDHPQIKVDTKPPIGVGLRSVARITNGLIRYDANSWNHIVLNELQITISEGAVERDEQDRMVAYLCTTSPIRSIQELNERLGLSSFEMMSDDSSLSVDSTKPTIFGHESAITLPEGEQLLDMATWKWITLDRNVRCYTTATAAGVLRGQNFVGAFDTKLTMDFGIQMILRMRGSFTVHLA